MFIYEKTFKLYACLVIACLKTGLLVKITLIPFCSGKNCLHMLWESDGDSPFSISLHQANFLVSWHIEKSAHLGE